MIALAILLFGQVSGDLISAPGAKTKTCQWPGFDAKSRPDLKHASAPAFELKGSPDGMNGSVVASYVIKPPTGRILHFRIAIRGSHSTQGFAIVANGHKPRVGKELPWTASWINEGKVKAGQWTIFKHDYVLPPESNQLGLVIHNLDKEPIYFSDPHLTVGAPAEPDKVAIAAVEKIKKEMAEEAGHPRPSPLLKKHDELATTDGDAIIRLKMCAPLRTDKPDEVGVVTFPMPTVDGSQVPLDFKIEVDKPGKLIGFKWRKREDGRNLVCDATVQPGPKGSWVHYEALVLVRKGPQDLNEPSVEKWTKSTACVQWNNAEMLAIAKRLANGAKDSHVYAQRVFEFVRDNTGRGAPFKTLDASAGLACGGSCTNHSNLAAALLRAHGIPARTVAHMPTWCGLLYEHWLTEYFLPGEGWLAMDTSLGRMLPDRRTRVVLNVANEQDEDRSFEPLHTRFVMPGAPFQSVAELSAALFPADLTDTDGINIAENLCYLPTTDGSLFELSKRAFEQRWAEFAAGQQHAARFTALDGAAVSHKVETIRGILSADSKS